MRDQHSASCKHQVTGTSTNGSVPIAAPSSLVQLPNADVGLTAESFQIMYGSKSDDHKHLSAIPTTTSESSTSTLEGEKALATPRVTVLVQDMVKSIHMAVDAIPKTVPIAISLHPAVPQRIATDDLKVLRCALNLLEHCASIVTSGSILLSIKPQYCCCGKAMLGFHCQHRSEESHDTDPACADQCIRDCCTATRTIVSHDTLDLSTASTCGMSFSSKVSGSSRRSSRIARNSFHSLVRI